MAIGRGSASLNRYYFNQLNRRCEPFVYSGVGGNANNFQQLDMCRRQCPGMLAMIIRTRWVNFLSIDDVQNSTIHAWASRTGAYRDRWRTAIQTVCVRLATSVTSAATPQQQCVVRRMVRG
jgi:hypothetical protein